MHCPPWWVSSWALFWTSCWKKNPLFQFNWDWFLEIYLALLLKYSLLFLYFPWLSVLVCVHWMKQSVLLVLKDWSHAEDKPCQSAWPKLLVASLTFCLSKLLSLLLAAPNNWGRAKSHQCPKGVGNVHIPVHSLWGLLFACPFSFAMQANWKLNFHV